MKPKTRHLLKTISWRVISFIVAFLLAWLFTGNVTAGLYFGLAEFFIKGALYYYHERMWHNIKRKIKKKKKLEKVDK